MKWIGRLIDLIDGNHSYKVRIIEFDGVWFWARTAG